MTVRRIVHGKQDAARKWSSGRATSQRFVSTDHNGRTARLPPIDGEAMRSLRTMYPSTVIDGAAIAGMAVLKSGHNSPKIGAVVLKGRWRGQPIYTLTLEERATCPVSCRHLRSCFGNKMMFAHRFAPTPEFERALVRDVLALGRRHPGGFVVRLHVLGDFYSVRYVQLWGVLLDEVPALNVFGYTARIDDDDPIARELRTLVSARWSRFAVRFSNDPDPWRPPADVYDFQGDRLPATVSIELPVQRPADAFVCPEQWTKSGERAESCAACAACWSTRKRVAFLQH